jgi:hypothetical protein
LLVWLVGGFGLATQTETAILPANQRHTSKELVMSQYEWIPSDQESFWRQSGERPGTQIPEEIANEYFARLQMKHRDGGMGPLGSGEMRQIMREAGIKLKAPKDPQQMQLQWRQIPNGTRVKVVPNGSPAYFAVYEGICDIGTITVKPEAGGPRLEVPYADASPINKRNIPPGVDESSYDQEGWEQPDTSGYDAAVQTSVQRNNQIPLADDTDPFAGDEEGFFNPTEGAHLLSESPGPSVGELAAEVQAVQQQMQPIAAPAQLPPTGNISRTNWSQVPKGYEVSVRIGDRVSEGEFHSNRTIPGQSEEIFVVLTGQDMPRSFEPGNVTLSQM